jgi:regulator of replication initiation timing
MNLNTMTTSERERLAYAEGFVQTAKLFARLDDMHHALGAETAEDDNLFSRYRELIDERDELEVECDALKDERDSIYDDYARMRDERNTARVAVKMAIDLLEDPNADDTDANAVLAYLRDVW